MSAPPPPPKWLVTVTIIKKMLWNSIKQWFETGMVLPNILWINKKIYIVTRIILTKLFCLKHKKISTETWKNDLKIILNSIVTNKVYRQF